MSGWDPTKARLLEAAGEEFAEKGFDGATVRSICARAGANIAAVNYHFGDKEQLYLQAIIEAHRCGFEMASDDEFFACPPTEQLRRYIRHFLDNILAIDQAGGWQKNLMLREMMRPSQASERLVQDVIRPKFERLLRVLASVCPAADERRLHVLAFSIVGQCLHYKVCRPIAERLIGRDEYASLDLDYLTDHISAFSMAALGIGPRLNEAGEARGKLVEGEGEVPCAGSR
jgi:TetR/AcrR family transcriptional regulator, regulator of cefoperazone and chloramphenicol sensitivity